MKAEGRQQVALFVLPQGGEGEVGGEPGPGGE